METVHARIAYEACPLCDAIGSTPVLAAEVSGKPDYKPGFPPTISWLKCGACNHVYTDGYFRPESLAVLFADSPPETRPPGKNAETQRDVWAKVLDSVGAQRTSLGGRWLDVGFGDGALMATAAEYGYEVSGLDLRTQNVEIMRNYGFDAQTLDLGDYRPGELLDVISMADVLEHMPFPKVALRRARELLRPGGLLFVSMPNADSFVWSMLTRKQANPYWLEVEHYHNFSRTRLYGLLDECGFVPVRYGISQRYRACMEVIARAKAG
jgi:protein O-GlcNAc transferase